MKRLVKLFFAAMLCSLALASCVKPEEIENLQNQINEIKQENIASIESQIKAINSSIAKLETTDKELKSYIETLQTQQDELVKADEALTKSIADLRTELLNKVSDEKAAILLLLEAYKSEVEGSLAVINNQIIDLQAKDENLQTQITTLKTYVDTELKNTKDWATATFATLEQYNAVCTTIAGIQVDITSINQTIADLQTKTTQDKAELEGKITALDEKTAAALQSAVASLESTIATVKSELTAAYTEAIAAAITNLESSLKTWVNNQLTGYYTIAQMDAQLSTLEQTMNAKFAAQKEYLEGVIAQLSTALTTKIDANTDAITAIQSQLTTMSASLDLLKTQVTQNSADIVQLKADLASAKTSITTAYTAAINTAISTLDGKLSAEIESKVSAVNTALNNAVKDINDKITALTARIKACEDSIAGLQESIDKLLARIQSIVVLPSYSDGSVKMNNFGTTDICFEVMPRSASVALAKADISVFSLDAITTETKASIFTNIPVTKVADNGEVLIVTVNGSNLSADFFAGTQSMSARLNIQDGNSSCTSKYFTLSPNILVEHAGTLQDPFTVADVLVYTSFLDANEQSATDVYIKGVVTSVKEAFGSFGSVTLYIGDSADAAETFYVFRALGIGNKGCLDPDAVKAGDNVIVCGKVVNHNGTIPETVERAAYLYDINGKHEDPTPEPTTGSPKGTGTVDDPFNVAAAIAKCKETGSTATADVYYVKGKVTVVDESGAVQYGNITLDLVDEGFTAVFKAYRIKSVGGVAFTSEGNVAVGDEVVIKGQLVNYMSIIPEMSQNTGELVSVNGDMPVIIKYYIENGVNLGEGIAILGDWDNNASTPNTMLYWAPVNCGYEEVGAANSDRDHRLGKLYQWGAGDSSLPYFYNSSKVVAREMYYDTATPSPWYDFYTIVGTTSDKWNNNQGPCPEGWRLPTSLEFKVLCAGKNGSYGWVVKGTYAGQSKTYAGAEFFGANSDKTAGKGVFFPAAGYRNFDDGSADYRGSRGYYWSSTLNPSYSSYSSLAYSLLFYSSLLGPQYDFGRAGAHSVRCVSE